MGKISNLFLQSIIVMLLSSFFTFGLMYLAPSDPAEIYFSSKGIIPSNEALAAAREDMGLNDPFLVQYVKWMGNILQGDFGHSYISGRDVKEMFLQKLPYTIQLTAVSLMSLIFVAFFLGIIAAMMKDSVFDWLIRIFSLFGISMPSFWLGLLLVYWFSIKLHWFPINSTVSLKGIIMPAVTLSLPMACRYIRQIRTAFLEEMSSNYVTGLRSIKIKDIQIILFHILPNSMKGVVALIGLSLAYLLGGTVIVETIFSWPGIGSLAMNAITTRDYLVLQMYVLFMAFIYVSMSFLVEVVVKMMDPKFRLRGE